ncbi:TerB family tellurite resistance protein [Mariniblastus fucicola]|uniref:Dna-J like membrane chaperone protein n=1 Tax=Mariniblastus fucicola TaxID=980251 RepID=A0A5B9P6N2_9BACT|nr:TerB family tellurite resistance protein [Mariniblastus fucicola]QEG21934.1 Dna-J like membrane chaperone protein [Mariniblastus fucicola]
MSGMVKVEVLRAACCVAGGDGESTDAERVLLDRLATETGVGLASLEAMISRACTDENFCKEQFRVLKAEPTEAMAILLDVAMADGVIDDKETAILKCLSERLEVPAEVFSALLAKAKEIADGRR